MAQLNGHPTVRNEHSFYPLDVTPLTTRKDNASHGVRRCERLHPDKRVLVESDRAQFAALPYTALDGTDHVTHQEQASMIRRYIIGRNNHAYHERLRCIIARANVA